MKTFIQLPLSLIVMMIDGDKLLCYARGLQCQYLAHVGV